jgi:hypothetical protein
MMPRSRFGFLFVPVVILLAAGGTAHAAPPMSSAIRLAASTPVPTRTRPATATRTSTPTPTPTATPTWLCTIVAGHEACIDSPPLELPTPKKRSGR